MSDSGAGRLSIWLVCALALAGACSGSDAAPAAAGTRGVFDLDADLAEPGHFWDLPWPSDLRRDPDGTLAMAGYPVPAGVASFAGLVDLAEHASGYPVVPVIYFRFDGALAQRAPNDVIAASPGSPVLLFDLDASATPGAPSHELVPTVAETLGVDDYAPAHLLAVAPRPGFVLRARHRYGVAVRRSLGDAAGEPLGAPAGLAALAAGRTPPGARGAAARDLYAPLFAALVDLGVPVDDVAAATVFTTRDVVAETADLSDALLARDRAVIGSVALDADAGAANPRYCRLTATVSMPTYQQGAEPFDTGGRFDLGEGDLPIVQKTLDLPVVFTVPRQPMPAAGYPLVLYFHGSGGLHTQVVDRGPAATPGGDDWKHGEGPAYVLAAHGFGAAGTALPVNPERVPGASDIEYLNLGNLAAFPFTFLEGVIEQRLFLDALLALRIPPAVLSGCEGPTLPPGASAFRFDPGQLYAQGQSMGGMYTNMVGAVEGRFRALVPTGAGGFWSFMLPYSSGFQQVLPLLPILLSTNQPLHFTHPGLHLLEIAWEPAEPLVYMPRLSRRPLSGRPARPVYEPVGAGDTYFGVPVYDAVALAYGHREIGEAIWPSMQQALALAGLDGLLEYPVAQDLTSEDGERYTGVVVQFNADGPYDPHSIYAELDAVRYQIGCFLDSMKQTGVAEVPAPMALDAPCPPP